MANHTSSGGLTLAGVGALTLGIALSLGLFLPTLRNELNWTDLDDQVIVAGVLLGGPSFVGVPWLLWRRRRPRVRADRLWGPGRLLWFAHGSAAWLLWPPVLGQRVLSAGPWANRAENAAGAAQMCYFYGTPLMAVYMLLALKFGGRLGRSRRGRRRIDWIERLGLVLAWGWAAIGAIVHGLIYANRFR